MMESIAIQASLNQTKPCLSSLVVGISCQCVFIFDPFAFFLNV